jgi:hypothetical protein
MLFFLGSCINAYAGTNLLLPTTPTQPIPIIFGVAPAAPSGVSSEVYVTGYVELKWIDNSTNENSFTVYRAVNSGTYTEYRTGLTDTSMVDYYTQDGNIYYYVVKAVNVWGVSDPSNENSATVPLHFPYNFKATQVGSIVKLTWEDYADTEQNYVIERVASGGPYQTLATIPANSTSYDDSDVTAGLGYMYRVYAKNVNMQSEYSFESSVIITPAVSPVTAPSTLVATLSSGVVGLTWKDNSSNEDGFTVERKLAGGSYKYLNGTSSGMTSLVDNSVVSGSSYVYRVKAINILLGDSTYSNEAAVIGESVVPLGTVDFSSASSWAVPEIQKAIDYKLTTDKVLIDFTKKITREEFCEIAVKLYEAISGKTAVVDVNPFIDTTNTEILKAYKLGIVKGMSANTFAPGSSITRQEISVMLLRALKAAEPGASYSIVGAPALADENQIATWAFEAVKYMNKEGIMNGVGENRIDPLGNTTKEQAIALLKRLYEKSL